MHLSEATGRSDSDTLYAMCQTVKLIIGGIYDKILHGSKQHQLSLAETTKTIRNNSGGSLHCGQRGDSRNPIDLSDGEDERSHSLCKITPVAMNHCQRQLHKLVW